MHWLNITHEPRLLTCVYCGQSGRFRHVKSYFYENETFSLHACSKCNSLIYDLTDIDAPIVSQADLVGTEISREARCVIETGFSSYHVAECALSTLPDIPEHELRDHVFVDVGAGMGMASYFVKTLFGLKTVTVEPSYTGKLAQDILGLHVYRAYFENLPKEVLDELANKPCLLQLNSVIEHLVDPAAVLADMIDRAQVKVLAAVVPDGMAMDFDSPFLSALPFLAPRDHRHLPSKLGMELLLKRLGFQYVSVEATYGLITGVGSRSPFPFPSERTIKLAEHVFLENLLRHPNQLVASGGASRLLPTAVINNNAPLTAQLVAFFPYEEKSADILAKVAARSWDDLPFHLGPTCYWLAYNALREGRVDGALALLQISKAFADVIADDYPTLAMTALEFKWAALLLESQTLAAQGKAAAAEAPLRAILDSKSNAKHGARALYIRQAETDLKTLRTRAEDARLSAIA